MKLKKIIRNGKTNQNGESTIYFRLTINRKSSYLSTGCYINPNLWDVKLGKVKFKATSAKEINQLLSSLESKLTAHIYACIERNINATAASIIKNYKSDIGESFNSIAHSFIEQYSATNKIGTRDKVKSIVKKVNTFNGGNDTLLSEITYQYLLDYEKYCRTVLGNKDSTIANNMKFIRQVINRAIKLGKFEQVNNPFAFYIIREPRSARTFLTKSELTSIKNLDLTNNKNLSKCKDVFLFACYCGGLRISDVIMLEWSSVENKSISITTRKTGQQISLPMNETAYNIINSYRGLNDKYVFNYVDDAIIATRDYIEIDNIISRVTASYNKYLKRIGQLANITKNLSSHVARHTFATISLSKGIPIEVVQKILGHSNIRETQIYAKVMNAQVYNAINEFDCT